MVLQQKRGEKVIYFGRERRRAQACPFVLRGGETGLLVSRTDRQLGGQKTDFEPVTCGREEVALDADLDLAALTEEASVQGGRFAQQTSVPGHSGEQQPLSPFCITVWTGNGRRLGPSLGR